MSNFFSNLRINLYDSEKILILLGNKLQNWLELIIKAIPNIIAATLIMLGFYILAKLSKKLSLRLLPKLTKNKAVVDLLKSILYFSTILLGVFIALGILNLDKTVTSILAGAGVMGLALGFAFQEIASNFVSGIFIAFREPYKIGDIIQIDEYLGKIQKVNLRTTNILTFQGLEVLIPNKYMFTKPFTNFTTTPQRRLDIEIGVSYSEDLEKVERLTIEALSDLEFLLKSKPIELYFKEFAASSINYTLRIWINYPDNNSFLKTRHNVIKNIKKLYDKHNITIPFPIRTIEISKQDASKTQEDVN